MADAEQEQAPPERRPIAEVAELLAQAARDLTNKKRIREQIQTQLADVTNELNVAADLVAALRSELASAEA